MQQVQRIREIKVRAEKVGSSLPALCREAALSYGSVARWLRPDGNPQLKLIDDAIARLERVVERREREVLRALAARFPDERLSA